MNSITPVSTTELAHVDQGSTNPAYVYLAGLNTKGGRRTQEQALHAIAQLIGFDGALTCRWSELRFEHTTAIKSKLGEIVSDETGKPLSVATINRYLVALRGTLEAAWKLGQMGAEDYLRARSIKSIKGQTVPAGRDLSSGEIDALVRACENDETPAGARDAAILAVTCPPCGLRRAEVVGLNIDDYDPDTGRLLVRGKGNKERTVYLENGSHLAMADWMAIRGDEPGALFRAVNKGGNIRKGRMTSQAIYNMLTKRGEQAKVKSFSPHDLRRTTAGELLDAGVNDMDVANILGHSSTDTTRRYDRRGERRKKQAAGKVHFPYSGRRMV